MSKIRGPQIGNQQVGTVHLVSGVAVNSVVLSGNISGQKTFSLTDSIGLNGSNVSYNLDNFLPVTGGTLTGSVTVVGSTQAQHSVIIPSGSSFSVGSTLSGADILQALAGLHSTVNSAALKRLTDGTSGIVDHTHSASSLSANSEFELVKIATSSGDTIALTSGTYSGLQVPSGSSLVGSDIEVFINGQLVEYGVENGYTYFSGTVTFNPAVSGDSLSVVWRGINGSSSSGSGTTISSGTSGSGSTGTSTNQANVSGSTTTSGVTISSGTSGSGSTGTSTNQANVSGSTTTSGVTISSGTTTSSGTSLQAPATAQINDSGTASWSAVSGASGYEYQIGTASTPTSSWTQTPSLGAYQNLNSYAGQTVYLHVRAQGGTSYQTASVSVMLAAPSSVTLMSNGSGSWSAVSGASSYEYQITTSSTPGSGWVAAYSTSISANLSGYSNQTVYLHVRANGSTNYATGSVYVAGMAPSPSSVSLTTGGSGTWSSIAGVTDYEYQFTTSSTPDTGWSQTTSSSAAVSTSSYVGQTLYLHVRGYGSTNYGTASASIPYPAPSSASITTGGTLSWSSVTNATSYEYQVTSSSTPSSSWTTTYFTTESVSLSAYSNTTVYLFVRVSGASSYASASVQVASTVQGLSISLTTSSVTGTWTAGSGVVYQYQFSSSSTPNEASWQNTQYSGPPVYGSVSSVSQGQLLYLIVQESGTSATRSSVSGTRPYFAAPANVSLSTGGVATWDSVMGASSYVYQVGTSNTPTGSWSSVTTFNYPPSLTVNTSSYSGQTIYFFIKVTDSVNYGSASAAIPGASGGGSSSQGGQLAAPSSVTINSGGTAFWSSVAGATGYEYQLSTSSTPNVSWTTTMGTTASLNLSGYSNQTVYLHVRAQGSTNYATGSILVGSSGSGGSGSSQNYGPIFTGTIATQSGTVGASFSYTLPADSATDANNDPLTYSMSNLPAWASFNSSTRVLSGTPTSTGTTTISLSVSDGRGGTNSTTFDVTIAANQSPSLAAVSAQSLIPETPWSLTLPAAVDPENDSITYSVSNLPEWLGFSSVTRIVLGTPPISAQGTSVTITYTATDNQGNATSREIILNVIANANAPTVINPVPDQTATLNQAFTYTLAENIASDADNDTLTIVSVDNLPDGLSYTSGTRIISGTPTSTGVSAITVTISDGKGRTVSDSFNITVSDGTLYNSVSLTNPIQVGVWGVEAWNSSSGQSGYYPATIPAYDHDLWSHVSLFKDGQGVSNDLWGSYFSLTLTSAMSYVSSSSQSYPDPEYPIETHEINVGSLNPANFLASADGYSVTSSGNRAYYKDIATFTITDGNLSASSTLRYILYRRGISLNYQSTNSLLSLDVVGGSSTAKSIVISTFNNPRSSDVFDFNLSNLDGITTSSLTSLSTQGSVSVSIVGGNKVRVTVGPFSSVGQTASISFAVTDGYFTTSTYTKSFVGVESSWDSF